MTHDKKAQLLKDLYRLMDSHGLHCRSFEDGSVIVVLDLLEDKPSIQLHLPHSDKESSL